jgi:hypothetical protein
MNPFLIAIHKLTPKGYKFRITYVARIFLGTVIFTSFWQVYISILDNPPV